MTDLIARVEEASPPRSEPRWAKLKPILQGSDGRWHPVPHSVAQPRHQPELVSWLHCPPGAIYRRSVWQVRADAGAGNGGNTGKHARSGHRLTQFESFPGMTPVEMRRRLVSDGLDISPPPIGEVMLRLPDTLDDWIGPLRVAPRPNHPERIATLPPASGFVERYSIPPHLLQEIGLGDGTIRLLVPGVALETHRRGLWAVQDDRQLVRNTWRVLRGASGDQAGALPTDDESEAMVRRLSRLKLVGPTAEQTRARIEAVAEVIEDIKLTRSIVDTVVSRLMKRPDIEARIESEVRQEAEVRIERLDDDLAPLRESKERKVEELKAAIEKAEAKLARLHAAEEGFREKTTARLREMTQSLMAEPIAALGRHFILDSLLGGQSPSVPGLTDREITVNPPQGDLATLDAIRGVAYYSKKIGLVSDQYLAAMAGLLCGGPLFLSGPDSFQLARLASSVVSSGNSWAASVPTAVFSLDDVLALPCVPLDSPAHVTHRIGDVLLASESNESVLTLVLRGVNRAPLETLHELLSGNAGPIGWRAGVDDYRQLQMDGRLAVIATLVQGPTTFRLSLDMLADGTLVRADDGANHGASPQSEPQYHMTPDTLAILRTEAMDRGSAQGNGPEGQFPGKKDELAIYRGVFRDSTAGTRWWFKCRVIPHLESLGGDVPDRELPKTLQEFLGHMQSAGQLDYLERVLEGAQ